MLRLAAAPPSRYERSGHQATVAGMAAAYRSAGVPARRGYSRLGALSRALAVKVAAAAGVLLLGGTAVATGTGNLPTGVQHDAHGLFSVLGVPVPDALPSASATPRPARSTPTTTPPTTPAPSPYANLLGLCRAWRAQQSGPARSADPVVQQLLAAAAGGADRVPALCATVLGHPSPSPSPSRSATKHPSSASPTPAHPGASKRSSAPAPTRSPSATPDGA